jgi:hypothetical protein
MIIAFSVHRSSDGSLFDFHINLYPGLDKYYMIESSRRYLILEDYRLVFHTPINSFL